MSAKKKGNPREKMSKKHENTLNNQFGSGPNRLDELKIQNSKFNFGAPNRGMS